MQTQFGHTLYFKNGLFSVDGSMLDTIKNRFLILWNARNYYKYDLKFYASRKYAYAILLIIGIAIKPLSKRKSLTFLMMSSRAKNTAAVRFFLKRELKEIKNIYYSTKSSITRDALETLCQRILIIKHFELSPDGVAKGLLIIKFSETLEACFKHGLVEILKDYYIVIIEPSWAGYALPQILALSHFGCDKFYIECADKEDEQLIKGLNSNLYAVRVGSGNWVDFDLFYPVEEQVTYDVILIANNNPIKRVYSFLKRIAKAEPGSIKVCLVCAGHGEERQRIRNLINYLRIDDLDYYEGVSPSKLNILINRSKYSCLFSLKEGSNRSLFESMAAGTHSLILSGNIGVDKNYFQGKGGSVIKESELLRFVKKIPEDKFVVRAWAEANISPRSTLDKILNVIYENNIDMISDISKARLKVNKPEMSYVETDSEYNYEVNRNIIFDLVLGKEKDTATEVQQYPL